MIWMLNCCASVRNPIISITWCRLIDRVMYSASVVEHAIIVCNLEAHEMGQPVKQMIHPVLDLKVMGSAVVSMTEFSPYKMGLSLS